MRVRLRAAAVCTLLIGLPVAGVWAADPVIDALRESERQLIRSSDIGAGYAAIINFASEPTISSSTL